MYIFLVGGEGLTLPSPPLALVHTDGARRYCEQRLGVKFFFARSQRTNFIFLIYTYITLKKFAGHGLYRPTQIRYYLSVNYFCMSCRLILTQSTMFEQMRVILLYYIIYVKKQLNFFFSHRLTHINLRSSVNIWSWPEWANSTPDKFYSVGSIGGRAHGQHQTLLG